MKFTCVLNRQHIGRMFKKHWLVQGQRTPIDTGAEAELLARGIPICDANDVVKEKHDQPFKIDVRPWNPAPVPLDETHPHWHSRPCYVIGDNDVLIEGLQQAQIITKTTHLTDTLPYSLQLEKPENVQKQPKIIDDLTKQAILSAHLLDAQQEKLPVVKDPSRPAWNFTRTSGITSARKMRLLTSKILQLCENNCSESIAAHRMTIENGWFSVPFERDGDLFQIQTKADRVLLGRNTLPPIQFENSIDFELPNIFPLSQTITIQAQNLYELNNFYPLSDQVRNELWAPHTIFLHHDATKVTNLHETEVTEHQILGRSLLKSFSVAAAFARRKFGIDVKDLPEPVVIQCVHTVDQSHHIGVLQLNTLKLEGPDGLKNVWFSAPRMDLYQNCEYSDGKPKLDGYNPMVIRQLLALYNNY